jgi:hypothetical protein
MGGREEYQRASQLSTSFHSTSKWVLGNLASRGWLYGIPTVVGNDEKEEGATTSKMRKSRKKQQRQRRPTRLLEVGAINTELLEAACRTERKRDGSSTVEEEEEEEEVPKYRLDVRAIDIHSMEERIEEADFLTLPFTSSDPSERYDVIVCSMVLNCVTTPSDRGKMLARLHHHLRPGGLCFLTIPKFCLTKSAFLTSELFLKMLGGGGVGFAVEETKESPRLSFFVCRRPEKEQTHQSLKAIWKKQIVRNKGKKFPNQFSVVLDEDEIFGRLKLKP